MTKGDKRDAKARFDAAVERAWRLERSRVGKRSMASAEASGARTPSRAEVEKAVLAESVRMLLSRVAAGEPESEPPSGMECSARLGALEKLY